MLSGISTDMKEDIPHLNENNINESLIKLENLDVKSASLQEIDEILFHLFKGYRMDLPELDPKLNIVRGRVITEKPIHVKDISYPAPELVIKANRANSVGQSMFYASTDRNAMLFEIGAGVNDWVAVSYWQTKSKMIVTHVGFTDDTSRILRSSRKLGNLYKFVEDTKSHSALNNQVYSFLGRTFSQKIEGNEQHKYKLTNVIAQKLLASDLIEGILYPTVAMNGNADNLVLKPQVANSNLELQYVDLVKVTGIYGPVYTTKTYDSAVRINSNGKILWVGKNFRWNLPLWFRKYRGGY